ncbi:MAG: TraB/GumN family protein [Cyanobacteria bacterium J06632_3]
MSASRPAVGQVLSQTVETQSAHGSQPLRVSQTAPVTKKPIPSQTDSSFLWTIDTPSNTVYLLGSVHMLSAEDYPLAQSIQAAFLDAETVVFELDLNETTTPEAINTVLESALPDNQNESLRAALTPELYDLAADASADIGLPIASFDRFEPWFFSTNLVVMKLAQLGFSNEYGVDGYFFQQALEAGKEIVALETLAEQIGLFDSLPIATQQAFVEQTINDLENLETSFNDIRTAWHNGDVDTMEALVIGESQNYPALHDALFTQRNNAWMDAIAPMLNQSDDYLIVVGAGHLVGETGLIEQLQALGYTLEQQ